VDLICYLHPGWDPQIRPAEATRDWMDQTNESFAYRCLPLNIANAHGWEVLCPCDCTAVWYGGADPSQVVVTVAPGTPAHEAPVALFGQAVLTFHIQGIMRTPPGWNLWVGGSPNTAKHGIAPLTGVIETDWSPYSFTMNWRFTQPNLPVSFRKGEPICFFFPVPRTAMEEIRPRFADMTADLKAQFAAWSASRNAFHEQMIRNPPRTPSERWQKRYYRGIDMHDRQGAPDHLAKLRLKPFAAKDQPHQAADPQLSLRGTASRLGHVLQSVAKSLAAGTAPEIAAAGLQELGLTEPDARAVIAAMAEI
jgi:hypothetical protein